MKKVIILCTLFGLHSLCMALEPEQDDESRSSETHRCVIVNMNSVVHYPKERDGRKFSTYGEFQAYEREQKPKRITNLLATRFQLLITLKKLDNKKEDDPRVKNKIINKIKNNKSDLRGILGKDPSVVLKGVSLDESYHDSPEALNQHILGVAKLGWFRVNQGLASEEHVKNKEVNLAKVKRALQAVNIQTPPDFFTLRDDLSFLPRTENTQAEEAEKSAKNIKADGALKNNDLVPAISG